MYNDLQSNNKPFFQGIVDHVSPSFAYILTSVGEKDVFVYQKDLAQALHGDLVEFKLKSNTRAKPDTRAKPNTRESKPEGRVVRIISRSQKPVVGRMEMHKGRLLLLPDGRRMHHPIDIINLKGAVSGDKVVAKITSWPPNTQYPKGEINKVLGVAGEHTVEMHAILAEFGLSEEFPSAVNSEAMSLSGELINSEISRRRDMRAIPTCTIDPEDAKDFDDALSFSVLSNGNYEIGVHIADVSYYVAPGTLLDAEAYERGTSVYLVDRTVPMLPKRLSSDLCSLKQHVDRLAFSIIWEMDTQGNIQKEWIGETVINSDRRFTYLEAQEVIDKGRGDLAEPLKIFHRLAFKFRAERFKSGAINLETPEIQFQLDPQGKPIQVKVKEMFDTHKVIEEWMLLANRRVGTWVKNLPPQPNGPTFVYRTHDEPNVDKLSDFFRFTHQLGVSKPSNTASLLVSINFVTEQLRDHVIGSLVQIMAVRTMAKAIYTTSPNPHFGLGFAHYTHFTSPIRRYPDIMVHRFVKAYIKKEIGYQGLTATEKQCQHALARERVAADAERASISYKQVEYLQNLGNKVLDGVIGSITSWGMYVELIETKLEGLVHLSNMKDDYYDVDLEHFCVSGRRHKKVYRLGSQVKVQVLSCDLSRRIAEFSLVL